MRESIAAEEAADSKAVDLERIMDETGEDKVFAAMGVAKTFNAPFMGVAGTCHQTAAHDAGVPFLAGAHSSPFHASVAAGTSDGTQSGSRTWTIALRASSSSRSAFPYSCETAPLLRA